MTQKFESASAVVSDRQLLLRGVVVLMVTALVTLGLVAKSEGFFSHRVEVVALLKNVGDGLPDGSDVKFRGALVGTVEGVTPALDGGSNKIALSLDPHFAHDIPNTVTARVVPSNVFAVSSVQLVDNGPAPGLRSGARIVQDQSLATVQFQTALTKLRDVLSAAGRPGSDNAVGVLSTVAEATRGRGDDLSHAGGAANRIVDELNAVMADDGTESTLGVLSDALQGLQSSAPHLLDAVHNAVVPMRTLAEKRQELTNFLSAGHTTFGTLGTAFENNTDRMIVITTQFSPVLGVLADGGHQFATIMTRINTLTNRFFEHVWKPERNSAQGKFMLVFTPNRMYTRQDCPRYGELEGPSCHTAPTTSEPATIPPVMHPDNYPVPPELTGGNVGSVGGPREKAQMRQMLGPGANPASELLLGPVARGNTVQVVPDPPPPAPPQPPPPAEVPPAQHNQPAPGGTP